MTSDEAKTLTDTQLRTRYVGAWNANDVDTARAVKAEARRRGFEIDPGNSWGSK